MYKSLEKRIFNDANLVQQLDYKNASYKIDMNGFIYVDPQDSIYFNLIYPRQYVDADLSKPFTNVACPGLKECGRLLIDAHGADVYELEKGYDFSTIHFDNLEKASSITIKNSISFSADSLRETGQLIIDNSDGDGPRHETDTLSLKSLKTVGQKNFPNSENSFSQTVSRSVLFRDVDFYVENVRHMDINSLESVERYFYVSSSYNMHLDAQKLQKAGGFYASVSHLYANQLTETDQSFQIHATYHEFDRLKKIGADCIINGSSIIDLPALEDIGGSLKISRYWGHIEDQTQRILRAEKLKTIGSSLEESDIHVPRQYQFLGNKDLTVCGKPYHTGMNGHGFSMPHS